MACCHALLQEHGAALCLHDMAGSAVDGPAVGPFTYVRFHGAVGKYFGSYGDDTLGAWARRLAAEWRGQFDGEGRIIGASDLLVSGRGR